MYPKIMKAFLPKGIEIAEFFQVSTQLAEFGEIQKYNAKLWHLQSFYLKSKTRPGKWIYYNYINS
jgi:hypothetical protein